MGEEAIDVIRRFNCAVTQCICSLNEPQVGRRRSPGQWRIIERARC